MFCKSDCFLLIALNSVCDSERFGFLTISLGFYFMIYWFSFYMYVLMFEHWLLQGILIVYLTDWEHTADSSQCGFRSHWMWDIREGRISEPRRIGERSCRSLYHQGAEHLRCWSFLTSKSVCNSTSHPWWTLTEQAIYVPSAEPCISVTHWMDHHVLLSVIVGYFGTRCVCFNIEFISWWQSTGNECHRMLKRRGCWNQVV